MTPFYEEGTYTAEIVNQALGKASTGTPQIILRIRVYEDEHGVAIQQYDRTIYRAITPKTMQYVVKDLKAIGYDRDSFKHFDVHADDFVDLRGRSIKVFCRHEPDRSGELRERWGIVTERDFEVEPVSDADIRKLDALYGKSLKPLAEKRSPVEADSGPQPSKRANPTNPPEDLGVTNDDIPF